MASSPRPIQMPTRILPDDIARSIYEATEPNCPWNTLGPLERMRVSRLVSAAAAYSNNLRTLDQKLDLEQGAHVLLQARS